MEERLRASRKSMEEKGGRATRCRKQGLHGGAFTQRSDYMEERLNTRGTIWRKDYTAEEINDLHGGQTTLHGEATPQ